MTGYWVIRTYLAGMVGEKIKYWVPGEKPSRAKRRLRSDIRQQQRNEASAEKRMARLVHANFGQGGKLVRLSYDDTHLAALGGGDEDALFKAAHHELRLWLRRARRACAAAGVELRYIALTSDVDGKTGELVRVHHHVILNAEAAEIARGKWTAGQTHREWLDRRPDKTELVKYLLGQVRRLPDEKKYIPSRNLEIPQPADRIARSGAELAVPKGGMLLRRSEWCPGMPQYIRYIVAEKGEAAEGQALTRGGAGAPEDRISGGGRSRRSPKAAGKGRKRQKKAE